MTNSEAFPSQAEALAQAIRYVQDMANGMTAAERAHLWFDIAVELRTDAQWRAVRERIQRDRSAGKLDAAGIPSPRSFRLGEPATERFQRPPDFAVTQVFPVEEPPTQRIEFLPWSLGDKADCRHCHTPIEYAVAATKIGSDPVNMPIWRHRYTQQAVCVAPIIAADETAPQHTFAEPEPRG